MKFQNWNRDYAIGILLLVSFLSLFQFYLGWTIFLMLFGPVALLAFYGFVIKGLVYGRYKWLDKLFDILVALFCPFIAWFIYVQITENPSRDRVPTQDEIDGAIEYRNDPRV